MYFILLCILCTSFPLFSIDVVTFIDGSIMTGEVFSYSSLGEISMKDEDGAIKAYPSADILSIEKPGTIGVSLGNQGDCFIHYVEGVNKLFHYVPPYYIYKEMSYNIDTGWGIESDVGMFFSFLKTQHPDLDEHTLFLIDELDRKMLRQNRSMGASGIMMALGTVMTFLPLNFDDISATPTYGKVIALSGFSINIVGLSIAIYNLFHNQREYPELIAHSFNEWILQQQ